MSHRKQHHPHQTLLLLFLITLPVTVFANKLVQIPTVETPITLDGQANEDFWEKAHSLPLRMSQPVYGDNPSVISLVKIAHRDGSLFIGGKLYYSEHGTNTETQLSRDDLDFSSDLFGLIIDSYNDEENAYGFVTSPSGHKTDLSISNDASTAKNLNWNTFWSVSVRNHSNYWSFEIEIPLSSIQYQVENGKVSFGLSVWRYVARNNEFDTYPLITNQFGNTSYFKPSLTADFSITYSKSERPLYLTPYLMGGYNSQLMFMDGRQNNSVFDAGLDAKLKPLPSFTLDVTINTDFAQIESDNQQINLTRFPLSQPEKRSFFQERSGLFSFNTGGPTTLFYSRRIGLTSEGQQIPLYGGVRLTGRYKEWDIGILNMQSAPKFNSPGENYGVFRVRNSLSESNSSYWGVMATSRIATSKSYNIAYGADIV